MIPYKTSRDMHHLKELLDKGYEVVCFYTHDVSCLGSAPIIVTEVCTAKYIDDGRYSKYQIACKGMAFLEYYIHDRYMYTFEEAITERDIQFIEPTILNEKDILELASEKKRKDMKHEHCGNCRYFMSDECLNPQMLKGATEEGWEYLQVDANDDACGEFIKGRRKNPRTQFELKAIKQGDSLREEYQWCVDNLSLKEDKGVIYQVDEIYIITSSQTIIDKVNKHFGSKFSFDNTWESRVYYIN